MSLIEKVKRADEESYEKWFERWFKKEDLESKIIKSAKEGYTGFSFEVSGRPHDSDRVMYEKRRMQNSRFKTFLEERLGEGFKITTKTETFKPAIFQDILPERKEVYVVISWEETK
ncbi:hypothetical protein [Salinicoccus roseus]|uniref:Uncharacterized protein n=1 Tax=Salinicoccus roseus TaxID=45670 RepID=A0ABT4YKX2_9STAP|nr:hypothetical protein [Salinicoccus roseus]MDB0581367.1 hypothetical protein [Salinicoccus roseus]